MRKLFPLLFAATVLADAPPPSTEDALVAHVTAAKFTESKTPNSPKGSQGAVIGVDPNTKGATNYARTPAGTGLPAHWHSFAEYTVFLAGKPDFWHCLALMIEKSFLSLRGMHSPGKILMPIGRRGATWRVPARRRRHPW